MLVTRQKYSVVPTFMRNEMVIKIEKMNMPPSPYKCRVLLPIRSIKGMITNVIATIIAPIPIVMNLDVSSVNPELINKPVE